MMGMKLSRLTIINLGLKEHKIEIKMLKWKVNLHLLRKSKKKIKHHKRATISLKQECQQERGDQPQRKNKKKLNHMMVTVDQARE